MNAASQRNPRGALWRVACLLLLALTHAASAWPATRVRRAGQPFMVSRLSYLDDDTDTKTIGGPASVTYVTSASTTSLLTWWAAFLVGVSALGVIAICVLPIYYCYRNQIRRSEETARAAEIKKSMQEMTTRLYRTRQHQHERNAARARLSAPLLGLLAVAENDVNAPAVTNLRMGSFPMTPLASPTSASRGGPEIVIPALLKVGLSNEEQQHHAARSATSREGPFADVSVADSNTFSSQRKCGGALTRDDPRAGGTSFQPAGSSTETAVLPREVSQLSAVSSPSSAPGPHRHASAATLAVRSSSSRSLARSVAAGGQKQQMGGGTRNAVPVRAFAGMEKVKALRRALGGAQLHSAQSTTRRAARNSSSSLRRQTSTIFVTSGAFDEGSDASSSSSNLSLSGTDLVRRSPSDTLVADGDTVGFATVSPPLLPPPPPPPIREAAVRKTAAQPFVQASKSSVGASANTSSPHEAATGVSGGAAPQPSPGRQTIDRTSAGMQRLLRPTCTDAAVAMTSLPTAPLTTTAAAQIPPPGVDEWGGEAPPRVPGAMEGTLFGISAATPTPPAHVGEHGYTCEDGEGEAVVSSSKSSRFVLTRSEAFGEGHRVVGRPVTVGTTPEEEGDVEANASRLHEAAVGTGEGKQHVLAHSPTRLSSLRRTVLPSSPSPSWHRGSLSFHWERASQSEEYLRLMDSQFQMRL